MKLTLHKNSVPQDNGIIHNVKNWGKDILDKTMFGTVTAGFDATNPKAFNYNPALEGQIDYMKDLGDYGVHGFKVG